MANFFWVGGSGNINDQLNHWALVSGGPGQALAPSSTDDVFFDGNSGTGTVTVNVATQVQGMDWSASSGLGLTQAALLEIFGTLVFKSGMSYTHGSQTLGLRNGAASVTFAGLQPFNLTVTATGAKTLQDNLTIVNDLSLTLNTLTLNGKTVSVGRDCLQAGGTITGSASSVLTITRDFTVSSGASSNLSAVAVTVGRDYTQSGGTIVLTGQTGFFKINRSFLKTAGTITAAASTIVIIMNGNGTDGQFRLNATVGATFQFNSAGGTGVWILLALLNLSGVIRVTSGSFDTGGFSINTAGVGQTGTLTVDGGNFLATGSSTVSRSLYTRTSGSTTWGSSTSFSINATGTIPTDSYNNVFIAEGAGGNTTTLSGNTSCKNMTVTSDSFGATLNISTFILHIAGNLDTRTGTLTCPSGILDFSGPTGSVTVQISNTSQTIGTLKCIVPGKTLVFDVAATQIISITNSLYLESSFSNKINIQSASGGSQCRLDLGSSSSNRVVGVKFTDTRNNGTPLILARMSNNNGNNNGIKFAAQSPMLGKLRSPVGSRGTV